MTDSVYRGIIITLGIAVAITAIAMGSSQYAPLSLVLIVIIDIVLAKLREEKEKGRKIKDIKNWHPMLIKKNTSILGALVMMILGTFMIYISVDNNLEYMLIVPIIAIYIMDIAEKISPVVIYEKGMQIGIVFAEWKYIELGATYRGVTTISYKTKRALGGRYSIRITEIEDLNDILRQTNL